MMFDLCRIMVRKTTMAHKSTFISSPRPPSFPPLNPSEHIAVDDCIKSGGSQYRSTAVLFLACLPVARWE